ncbi:MAG TPA: hypothetical protein VL634_20790 [Mycobacterium sp.]|nr:hypothetical protein [Mycobacterium sp.]
MDGRFDTEAEAWRAAAKVLGGACTETRLRYITSTLTGNGLALGRFDVDVARLLARLAPEELVVVLSWAERAYAAGQRAGARRSGNETGALA